MKNQSSENKLVIAEEFIFDQNTLSKDSNNHFKFEPAVLEWLFKCLFPFLALVACFH